MWWSSLDIKLGRLKIDQSVQFGNGKQLQRIADYSFELCAKSQGWVYLRRRGSFSGDDWLELDRNDEKASAFVVVVQLFSFWPLCISFKTTIKDFRKLFIA